MGQAKSRGTFEQRRAAAVERRSLADEEARRKASTPEEVRKRVHAAKVLALVGMWQGGISRRT